MTYCRTLDEHQRVKRSTLDLRHLQAPRCVSSTLSVHRKENVREISAFKKFLCLGQGEVDVSQASSLVETACGLETGRFPII